MNAYDRDGRPLGSPEVGRLLEDVEARTIDGTIIDGVKVSTVFLVIDHGFGADGPPVLYETMIFGGQYNGWCDRYTTEDDARFGHQMVVSALRAGRDPDEGEEP
jgi:hypothetical protein